MSLTQHVVAVQVPEERNTKVRFCQFCSLNQQNLLSDSLTGSINGVWCVKVFSLFGCKRSSCL